MVLGPGPDGKVVAKYRPSAARAYFAQRHRNGERLQLVVIDVNYEKERDIGHVSYVITRQANDLQPIGEPGLVVARVRSIAAPVRWLYGAWAQSSGKSLGHARCRMPGKWEKALLRALEDERKQRCKTGALPIEGMLGWN